jgi:hypothetical protein
MFGSRVRGQARADSDFDIAVLLDEEAARAERGATLRRILGRLGREIASTQLDLVVLNDAPPLLRHRVLRDGVLLFARAPEERSRFARQTIREYQDGSVWRAEHLRRRIERLKRTGTKDGRQGDLLEAARRTARLFAKARGIPER